MMARTFASIAMLLLLGALPAAAAHRSHDPRDEKLLAMAQRLERASHELYCEAAERPGRLSWMRWSALRSLRELDFRARAFRHQVERRGGTHPATLREFRQLENALRWAALRLPRLRDRHSLRGDLARIDQLADRVEHRLATHSDTHDDRRHDRDRRRHARSAR